MLWRIPHTTIVQSGLIGGLGDDRSIRPFFSLKPLARLQHWPCSPAGFHSLGDFLLHSLVSHCQTVSQLLVPTFNCRLQTVPAHLRRCDSPFPLELQVAVPTIAELDPMSSPPGCCFIWPKGQQPPTQRSLTEGYDSLSREYSGSRSVVQLNGLAMLRSVHSYPEAPFRTAVEGC